MMDVLLRPDAVFPNSVDSRMKAMLSSFIRKPQGRFRSLRNSWDKLMGEYHFSSEIRVYMRTEFAVEHWFSHTGTLFNGIFLRYEHLRTTKYYPLLCRESSICKNARSTVENVFKIVHIAYMTVVTVGLRTHSPPWVWRQTLDLNNWGWLTANGW